MNKNVAAKILEVRTAIGVVQKGSDNYQRFKYQKWDDVAPAVWEACQENNVTVTPSVVGVRYEPAPDTKEGKVQFRPVVEMEIHITDVDSGEVMTVKWFGEAVGSDDKGLQKAITSANKYCFLKVFGIPFEEKGHDTDEGQPPAKSEPKRDNRSVSVTDPKPPSNSKSDPEQEKTKAYVSGLKLTAEQSAAIQKVKDYKAVLTEAAKDNWPRERVLDTFGLEVPA